MTIIYKELTLFTSSNITLQKKSTTNNYNSHEYARNVYIFP